MFSKAFGFIRINPNFASEKTGKFSKTADISTTWSGFLGGVDAGVKGETFYQLCKHSSSCLLLGVMKPSASMNLPALSTGPGSPYGAVHPTHTSALLLYMVRKIEGVLNFAPQRVLF